MAVNTIKNEWHNFAEVPKLITDQIQGGNLFQLSRGGAISWIILIIAVLSISNILFKYLNKPEYILKNPVYVGVAVALLYAAYQLYNILSTYSKLLDMKSYVGIFAAVAIGLVAPLGAMYYYSKSDDEKKSMIAIATGYFYSSVIDFIILGGIDMYASSQPLVVRQAISSSTFLLLPIFQITRTWRTAMQLAALNELV